MWLRLRLLPWLVDFRSRASVILAVQVRTFAIILLYENKNYEVAVVCNFCKFRQNMTSNFQFETCGPQTDVICHFQILKRMQRTLSLQ